MKGKTPFFLNLGLMVELLMRAGEITEALLQQNAGAFR
jgi:hypothetical protein